MKKTIVILVIIVLCQSCTVISRCVLHQGADIDDYKIFPTAKVSTGDSTFYFKEGNKKLLENYHVNGKDSVEMSLDDFLRKTSTVSFLVIRNDSILFENYYRGYDRKQISCFFSVSKSVTSLLIGMAIEDGYITSVTDTVTKYIPELAEQAPEFSRLTIEDLLNMRSGLRFKESYISPFSGMVKLYYGTNQFRKIKRMKFNHEPGEHFEYQSASTAILGIVLENATGKEFAKYLEEKVWIPLNMENSAYWSLDDKRNRSPKAYGGLNATATDLAKIGRLYLNKGTWNGTQLVSESWLANATTPNVENNGYQYQWRSMKSTMLTEDKKFYPDSASAVNAAKQQDYKNYSVEKEEKGWVMTGYLNDYYAVGVMKQLLYINPDKNIIIIRLGKSKDRKKVNYEALLHKIASDL